MNHKEKYPIIIRITILPVILCLCCVLWILIGMWSMRRLGKVLEETGRNLSDTH